jgi:hypothetical protein
MVSVAEPPEVRDGLRCRAMPGGTDGQGAPGVGAFVSAGTAVASANRSYSRIRPA